PAFAAAAMLVVVASVGGIAYLKRGKDMVATPTAAPSGASAANQGLAAGEAMGLATSAAPPESPMPPSDPGGAEVGAQGRNQAVTTDALEAAVGGGAMAQDERKGALDAPSRERDKKRTSSPGSANSSGMASGMASGAPAQP